MEEALWQDIKKDLRKIVELPTDILAHKLNIHYDSAQFIQDNHQAILKEGK